MWQKAPGAHLLQADLVIVNHDGLIAAHVGDKLVEVVCIAVVIVHEQGARLCFAGMAVLAVQAPSARTQTVHRTMCKLNSWVAHELAICDGGVAGIRPAPEFPSSIAQARTDT